VFFEKESSQKKKKKGSPSEQKIVGKLSDPTRKGNSGSKVRGGRLIGKIFAGGSNPRDQPRNSLPRGVRRELRDGWETGTGRHR